MKKRILTVLLAVCLVFTLGTVALAADGSEPIAIDAGTTTLSSGSYIVSGDITLTNGSLTVENGNDVTLTIADGATLTNKAGEDTIVVNYGGKLTINGNGTIDNISNTKAVIYNSGNVIINGGNIVRSQDAAGNSYYAILNHGTMTINDATVTVNNGSSSLIANGYYNYGSGNARDGYVSGTNSPSPSLTIVDGSFSGGMNSIKNDDGGNLKISGGTFSNSHGAVVLNWNIAEISGGSFTASSAQYVVIANGYIAGGNDAGQITISGGTFTAANNGEGSLFGHGQDSAIGGSVTITEGTFNGQVNVSADSPYKPVVSGGTFTDKEDVAEYLKPGLDIDEDGKVVVGPNAVAQVGNTVYTNLQDAIDAAQGTSNAVQILKNFTITVPNGTAVKTGAVNINDDVTINGNGYTITADTNSFAFEKDKLGKFHVINIQNGADVTITNLKIDGNKCARSGINVYSANGSVNASATLTGVTVRNCTAYGVVAASSTVTVNSITTSGNGWGGINVDSSYANAGLTVENATITDTYSVVVEGKVNNNVVDLKNGSYNNIQVKTSNSDVTIVNGSYYDIVGGDDYVPTRSDVVVKGGTFDNSVEKFADSKFNYEVELNGYYTYYTNASDAIAAAGPSGDVDYIGDPINTHTITFVYDKNTKTSIEVVNRDEIELPGGKYDGKVITGWTRGSVTYDVGDEVRVTDDMTFYVVLKDGEFDIVIDSKIEHGDISTNVNSADKGDTVYIYVDPDTGYVLDDIDVYYGLNYRYSVKVSYVRNNTYRFEMPNADVYITATFKANGMPFVDVHRTQWFYDSIYYVWSNDMMEGDSATTFNPDGTMTRAMFWAVLGRMDGQTITGTNWVEQARNWAMREGVSDGTNPNDYVTREQMVTMLWRYAGEKNGSANLNRYTDSGSVSGYAVEAMRWAIGNGVIQGVTSTTLAPKANATRAECATIFMRFDKM